MIDNPLKLLFVVLVALIYVYFKRNEIKTAFPLSKRATNKIHNDVREGFIQLVELLIHNSERADLKNHISAIQSQTSSFRETKKENYAILYLKNIASYVYEKDTRFITYTDWKSAVSDVVWNISKCLGNEGKNIELLTSMDEPKNTSISADGAFSDINKNLNNRGLQMAYIDDFSDGYHIFLYDVNNQEQVESAVRKIGLPCMQNIT